MARKPEPYETVDGIKTPKRPRDRLTAEQVRTCLDYDSLTGIFTWRVTQGNRLAGSPAGATFPDKRGYPRRRIQILKCRQSASVLAWLYVYGEWPRGEIDHKNCDTMDDRIENLRDASVSQNEMNKGPRRDNTAGFKGVSVDRRSGKFVAAISVNKTRYLLGYFREREHAAAAYRIAASAIQGDFARFSHG